jgi:hypothetical protein
MAVDLEPLDVNISMDISDDTAISTFKTIDDAFSVKLATDQDDDIFNSTDPLNIDVEVTISDGNIVVNSEDIDNILSMDLTGNVIDIVDNNTSEGTKNYNKLYNKPKISGTELIHDVPLVDIGVDILTNSELENFLI